ncbi:MAG TPA: tetratricopeptide repeat protein [Phycisphaerae bacterium]|nr:tetratricopeptide repeat protein [Phycisphaerae bacterium]
MSAPSRLLILLALLGSIVVSVEGGPTTKPAVTLRAARERALAGDYAEAVRIYEELAARPALALSAAIARSDVDFQVGDYLKGIERLQSVREKGEASADWHAALAALYAAVGKRNEAIWHNRQSLIQNDRHLRARFQLGQLYETHGEFVGAISTYLPFEKIMTGPELPTSAEELTYLGQGFLRYSTLTKHKDMVQRTQHVLTEVYQEAFEFVDAAYWPARLAAGELLLTKHNLREARTDFEGVLAQNPKAAEASVGLGWVALEDWEFDAAEKHAAAALAANPASVSARLLLGATRMTERRYQEAAAVAEEALQTNPNSIEALSLLAAARLRAGDKTGSRQAVERVEKICPKSAILHFTLGTWLSAGRQFTGAEEHFKKAIEFAPYWVEPRTALGQLYMETGEEHLARQALEESFALDSFDTHTHNVLGLLDNLDHFARLETKNFIIKYDAAHDAAFAPYLAETLEAFHPEICENFGMTPEKRTIIEVFPDHLGFSVRITGRPFIATVGACCGRVIAMQAPRGGPPFGPFNWATVLRHEFTHTVTLAATENRIPHWMTEGLAVHEEPLAQSWRAKQMLNDAVQEDRLFTLESIDWGFMRPKRPGDRSLAYAQSEWMMQFAIERFGYGVVPKLLTAFREGKDQPTAFKDVLGISTEQFNSDFRNWAKKQAAEWKLHHTPQEETKDVQALVDENPDDPALLARLAMAQLREGEGEAARQTASRALELNKDEMRALEVLASQPIRQLLGAKDKDDRRECAHRAEPYLRRLLKLDPKHPPATLYMGIVKQALGDYQKAIEVFTDYQRRYPDDPDGYRYLAGLYFVQERRGDALKQLEQLGRLSEGEAPVFRQIAAIYAEEGQSEAAARWYRRAIEVDPYDAIAHARLGELLMGLKDYAGARREFEVLTGLKPDEVEGFEGLRRAFEGLGDSKKAEEMAGKIRALRGEGPVSEGRE